MVTPKIEREAEARNYGKFVISPLEHGYGITLGNALELARGGDQRYVASPRVDSYHSIWFELHEDLIRLSGKKRAEATSG